MGAALPAGIHNEREKHVCTFQTLADIFLVFPHGIDGRDGIHWMGGYMKEAVIDKHSRCPQCQTKGYAKGFCEDLQHCHHCGWNYTGAPATPEDPAHV